jgi:hypothetical protein
MFPALQTRAGVPRVADPRSETVGRFELHALTSFTTFQKPARDFCSVSKFGGIYKLE